MLLLGVLRKSGRGTAWHLCPLSAPKSFGWMLAHAWETQLTHFVSTPAVHPCVPTLAPRADLPSMFSWSSEALACPEGARKMQGLLGLG